MIEENSKNVTNKFVGIIPMKLFCIITLLLSDDSFSLSDCKSVNVFDEQKQKYIEKERLTPAMINEIPVKKNLQ